MLEIGNELLKDQCEAQQVIVLRTEKGNTYSGISIGSDISDHTPEDGLLKALREADDPHVLYLVCIWRTKEIDIPSMHFRKALLEMDPRNGETQIWVQTVSGIRAKALCRFF